MPNSKGVLSSAIAGANAIALSVIQYSCDDDNLKEHLIMITPILIGAIIFIFDWCLAFLEFESAEKIRANNDLRKLIAGYEADIDRNKKGGRSTAKLEAELEKAQIARRSLHSLPTPKKPK